jgi:hypothetical protein
LISSSSPRFPLFGSVEFRRTCPWVFVNHTDFQSQEAAHNGGIPRTILTTTSRGIHTRGARSLSLSLSLSLSRILSFWLAFPIEIPPRFVTVSSWAVWPKMLLTTLIRSAWSRAFDPASWNANPTSPSKVISFLLRYSCLTMISFPYHCAQSMRCRGSNAGLVIEIRPLHQTLSTFLCCTN